MTESTRETTIRREHTVPPARTFVLRGGKVGILLIHGFAGTIADLRELGSGLHNRGFTVFGARLAGHGASTDELHNSRAEDWIASVRTSLSELSARCDRIIIIGESMGGMIALRVSREQAKVCGVVLLAPPFRLRKGRLRRIASMVFPSSLRWRKSWVTKDMVETHLAKGSLSDVTVGAYRQLLRLIRSERASLRRNSVPILALFAKQDFVTDPRSINDLQQALPASQLTTFVFDERVHHLMQLKDRSVLLSTITGFIDRVAKTTVV